MLYNKNRKIKSAVILMLLLGLAIGFFGFLGTQQALGVDLKTEIDTGLNYGTFSGLIQQDIRVIMRIIQIILGFLGVLAVLIILYGGFVWMTAGGDAKKIEQAKRILVNAAIGLVIIFSSFAIASFIVRALLNASGGGGGVSSEACDPIGAREVLPKPDSKGCVLERICKVDLNGNKYWSGAYRQDPFCPAPKACVALTISPDNVVPLAIKNVVIRVKFNQSVDIKSVKSTNFKITQNVTVADRAGLPGPGNNGDACATDTQCVSDECDTVALTCKGDEVRGTYTTSSSGKSLDFRPYKPCPVPNENRFCYEDNRKYTVKLVGGPGEISCINKSTLDCGVGADCDGEFTTGTIVDVDNPVFQGIGGQLCENISTVKVTVKDKTSQVASVEFLADGGWIDTQFPAIPKDVWGDVFLIWDPSLSGYSFGDSVKISAKAQDEDDNSSSISKNFAVRRQHCCNLQWDGPGDPDLALGEEPEEQLDCGGSCGKCSGGACDAENPENPLICAQPTDTLCAFNQCDTVSCLCVAPPIIDYITPSKDVLGDNDEKIPATFDEDEPFGAVGNIITIFGRNFGDYDPLVSRVDFFNGGGVAVKALLAQDVVPGCFDSWQNDRILVQVPIFGGVGSTSKIQVTAKNGLFDVTDDGGPGTGERQILNFNNTGDVLPGLCGATPKEGAFKEKIILKGLNLQAPDVDGIKFGIFPVAGGFVVFDDQTINGVEVPNLKEGSVAWIKAFVGANESNALPFKINRAKNAPVIYRFTPWPLDPPAINKAGKADYVTIIGANFGTKKGKVEFDSAGVFVEADYDFPQECALDYWMDSRIIVKVPLAGISPTTPIRVTRSDGETAVTTNFGLPDLIFDAAKPASPGICKIEPLSGPAGTTPVKFFGERLSSVDIIQFFKATPITNPAGAEKFQVLTPGGGKADQIVSFTDFKKGVLVPLDAQTGDVAVIDNPGAKTSNGIPFTIGKCQDVNACPGAGTECCLSGEFENSCMPAGQCAGIRNRGAYRWSFVAGNFGPHVVNECQRTNSCSQVCDGTTQNAGRVCTADVFCIDDLKLKECDGAVCVGGDPAKVAVSLACTKDSDCLTPAGGECTTPISSPGPIYPRDGEDVPVNAVISAIFSEKMDVPTITFGTAANSVVIRDCGSGAGATDPGTEAPCAGGVLGAFDFTKFLTTYNTKNVDGFRLVPLAGLNATPKEDLNPNTWYQIQLKATDDVAAIKSAIHISLNGNGSDPNTSDYIWRFHTVDNTSFGNIGCVACQPSSYTLREQYANDPFNANGCAGPSDLSCKQLLGLAFDQDHVCVELNTIGKQWAWAFANPTTAVEINDKLPDTITDEDVFAVARKDTRQNPPDPAVIKATIQGKTAMCKVSVDLLSPIVTSWFPNCGSACGSAAMGVSFSKIMDTTATSIAPNTSLFVYDCGGDFACDKVSLVNKVGIGMNPAVDCPTIFPPPPPPGKPAQKPYTRCNFQSLLSYTIDGINYSFVPGNYYRVVLHGKPDGVFPVIKSSEGIYLSNLNYNDPNYLTPADRNDSFSFVFKVNTDSNLCTVNRVRVSPDFTIVPVNEFELYHADPYSSPDSCEPITGQLLDNHRFNWDWTIDDFVVAKYSNYLDPGKGPNGEPVDACGNGRVEPGEDCDDGNTVDADSCGYPLCLNKGTLACNVDSDGDGTNDFVDTNGNTARDAGEEICCGNRNVDKGEDCDSADPFMNCSAFCLLQGNINHPPFAVCGNGVVETGTNGTEECDDINNVNGDGCSNTCILEGATMTVKGKSVCGDGRVGFGEYCEVCLDPVTLKHISVHKGEVCVKSQFAEGKAGATLIASDAGEDCDNQCRNKTPQPVAARYPTPVCGNGVVEVGEECEAFDASGNSTWSNGNLDGCQANCTREGSFYELNDAPQGYSDDKKGPFQFLRGITDGDTFVKTLDTSVKIGPLAQTLPKSNDAKLQVGAGALNVGPFQVLDTSPSGGQNCQNQYATATFNREPSEPSVEAASPSGVTIQECDIKTGACVAYDLLNPDKPTQISIDPANANKVLIKPNNGGKWAPNKRYLMNFVGGNITDLAGATALDCGVTPAENAKKNCVWQFDVANTLCKPTSVDVFPVDYLDKIYKVSANTAVVPPNKWEMFQAQAHDDFIPLYAEYYLDPALGNFLELNDAGVNDTPAINTTLSSCNVNAKVCILSSGGGNFTISARKEGKLCSDPIDLRVSGLKQTATIDATGNLDIGCHLKFTYPTRPELNDLWSLDITNKPVEAEDDKVDDDPRILGNLTCDKTAKICIISNGDNSFSVTARKDFAALCTTPPDIDFIPELRSPAKLQKGSIVLLGCGLTLQFPDTDITTPIAQNGDTWSLVINKSFTPILTGVNFAWNTIDDQKDQGNPAVWWEMSTDAPFPVLPPPWNIGQPSPYDFPPMSYVPPIVVNPSNDKRYFLSVEPKILNYDDNTLPPLLPVEDPLGDVNNWNPFVGFRQAHLEASVAGAPDVKGVGEFFVGDVCRAPYKGGTLYDVYPLKPDSGSLFVAHFDDSLFAQRGSLNINPVDSKGITYGQGLTEGANTLGKSIVIDPGNTDLTYKASGNINEKNGSIAFWVKPVSIGGIQPLFNIHTGAALPQGEDFKIYFDNIGKTSMVYFDGATDGDGVFDNNLISINEWHYIVAIWKTSINESKKPDIRYIVSLELYVDGKKTTGNFNYGNAAVLLALDVNTKMYIGSDSVVDRALANRVDALIDEFEIRNDVLSADEIQKRFLAKQVCLGNAKSSVPNVTQCKPDFDETNNVVDPLNPDGDHCDTGASIRCTNPLISATFNQEMDEQSIIHKDANGVYDNVKLCTLGSCVITNNSNQAKNIFYDKTTKSVRIEKIGLPPNVENASLALKLDFDTKDYKDLSAVPHTLACTGNKCPQWTSDGRFGGGIIFDGKDDFINAGQVLNPTDNTAPFTLSAWVKTDPNNNKYKTIIGTDISFAEIAIETTINNAVFGQNETGGWFVNSATSIPGNEWHHVVGVFEGGGGKAKIYVDGAWKAEDTRAFGKNHGVTLLGRFGLNNTEWFQGTMDEVRVWNRALSDSDVLQIYRGATLIPNNMYEVILKGGVTGIKNSKGVALTANNLDPANPFYRWSFTVDNNATLCNCDAVLVTVQDASGPRVNESQDTFICAGNSCPDDMFLPVPPGPAGNQHNYIAQCQDTSQEPHVDIVGATYTWVPQDTLGIIQWPAVLDTQQISVTNTSKDGTARVIVKGVGNTLLQQGGEDQKPIAITNFICSDPWPSFSNVEYSDVLGGDNTVLPYTNFSFNYCRDDKKTPSTSDDLPALNLDIKPLASSLPKTFIFPNEFTKFQKALNAQVLDDTVSVPGGWAKISDKDCFSTSVDGAEYSLIDWVAPNDGNYHVWADIYSVGTKDIASLGEEYKIELSVDGAIVTTKDKILALPGRQKIFFDTKYIPTGKHTFKFKFTGAPTAISLPDKELGLCEVGFGAAQKISDIIGIKVIENSLHLSPETWYASGVCENTSGTDLSEVCFSDVDCKAIGLTKCKFNVPNRGEVHGFDVSGFPAARSGRTVYVSAANLMDACEANATMHVKLTCDPAKPLPPACVASGKPCVADNLITNIYLLSYNENASAETIAIFDEILKRWKFMVAGISDDDKPKIRKDIVRYGDLRDIDLLIRNYNRKNKAFPLWDGVRKQFSGGTYVPGLTFSTWPSWKDTFSRLLGRPLSIDPINEFQVCPPDRCALGTSIPGDKCNANPQTCWDEKSLEFACPSDHAYAYSYKLNDDGTQYILGTEFEYTGVGTWNADRPNTDPLYSTCISGFGNAEKDRDQDGVDDTVDNCPPTACKNIFDCKNSANQDCNNDGDTLDPGEGAAEQCDQDNDDLGDKCDPCDHTPINDIDGDGVCEDGLDNASGLPDNCVVGADCASGNLLADKQKCFNPDQRDSDADNQGDACSINCQKDSDNDGTCDEFDNCPFVKNPEQENTDGNEVKYPPDVPRYCSKDSPDKTKVGGACREDENIGAGCCTVGVDCNNDKDHVNPFDYCKTPDALLGQIWPNGSEFGDACDPSTDTDNDGFSSGFCGGYTDVDDKKTRLCQSNEDCVGFNPGVATPYPAVECRKLPSSTATKLDNCSGSVGVQRYDPDPLNPLDNDQYDAGTFITTYNPGQEDNDRDLIGDVCDSCIDTDRDYFTDSIMNEGFENGLGAWRLFNADTSLRQAVNYRHLDDAVFEPRTPQDLAYRGVHAAWIHADNATNKRMILKMFLPGPAKAPDVFDDRAYYTARAWVKSTSDPVVPGTGQPITFSVKRGCADNVAAQENGIPYSAKCKGTAFSVSDTANTDGWMQLSNDFYVNYETAQNEVAFIFDVSAKGEYFIDDFQIFYKSNVARNADVSCAIFPSVTARPDNCSQFNNPSKCFGGEKNGQSCDFNNGNNDCLAGAAAATGKFASCLEIHNNNFALLSGYYDIYPGRDFAKLPEKVYCDMVTDGGGWTLVARMNDGDVGGKRWVAKTNAEMAGTWWFNGNSGGNLTANNADYKAIAFDYIPFKDLMITIHKDADSPSAAPAYRMWASGGQAPGDDTNVFADQAIWTSNTCPSYNNNYKKTGEVDNIGRVNGADGYIHGFVLGPRDTNDSIGNPVKDVNTCVKKRDIPGINNKINEITQDAEPEIAVIAIGSNEPVLAGDPGPDTIETNPNSQGFGNFRDSGPVPPGSPTPPVIDDFKATDNTIANFKVLTFENYGLMWIREGASAVVGAGSGNGICQQLDFDEDNIGDSCDVCTDRDNDTFGDKGYDFRGCKGSFSKYDNCPITRNPDQADYDNDTNTCNLTGNIPYAQGAKSLCRKGFEDKDPCCNDPRNFKPQLCSFCGGDACDLDADGDRCYNWEQTKRNPFNNDFVLPFWSDIPNNLAIREEGYLPFGNHDEKNWLSFSSDSDNDGLPTDCDAQTCGNGELENVWPGPLRMLSGLKEIVVFEVSDCSTGPKAHTFAVNTPAWDRLLADIIQADVLAACVPAGNCNTQCDIWISGFSKCYDVFFSDRDGRLNSNGGYLTVQSVRPPITACLMSGDSAYPGRKAVNLNIDAVQLNFGAARAPLYVTEVPLVVPGVAYERLPADPASSSVCSGPEFQLTTAQTDWQNALGKEGTTNCTDPAMQYTAGGEGPNAGFTFGFDAGTALNQCQNYPIGARQCEECDVNDFGITSICDEPSPLGAGTLRDIYPLKPTPKATFFAHFDGTSDARNSSNTLIKPSKISNKVTFTQGLSDSKTILGQAVLITSDMTDADLSYPETVGGVDTYSKGEGTFSLWAKPVNRDVDRLIAHDKDKNEIIIPVGWRQNTWHLITAVYDSAGGTFGLYADGEFKKPGIFFPPLSGDIKVTQILYLVGLQVDYPFNFLDIALDEVLAFNEIIDGTQIRFMYQAIANQCLGAKKEDISKYMTANFCASCNTLQCQINTLRTCLPLTDFIFNPADSSANKELQKQENHADVLWSMLNKSGKGGGHIVGMRTENGNAVGPVTENTIGYLQSGNGDLDVFIDSDKDGRIGLGGNLGVRVWEAMEDTSGGGGDVGTIREATLDNTTYVPSIENACAQGTGGSGVVRTAIDLFGNSWSLEMAGTDQIFMQYAKNNHAAGDPCLPKFPTSIRAGVVKKMAVDSKNNLWLISNKVIKINLDWIYTASLRDNVIITIAGADCKIKATGVPEETNTACKVFTNIIDGWDITFDKDDSAWISQDKNDSQIIYQVPSTAVGNADVAQHSIQGIREPRYLAVDVENNLWAVNNEFTCGAFAGCSAIAEGAATKSMVKISLEKFTASKPVVFPASPTTIFGLAADTAGYIWAMTDKAAKVVHRFSAKDGAYIGPYTFASAPGGDSGVVQKGEESAIMTGISARIIKNYNNVTNFEIPIDLSAVKSANSKWDGRWGKILYDVAPTSEAGRVEAFVSLAGDVSNLGIGWIKIKDFNDRIAIMPAITFENYLLDPAQNGELTGKYMKLRFKIPLDLINTVTIQNIRITCKDVAGRNICL